ncbi:MAG TPA: UDP-N-acetylglucosamine pyrophosphorylase [Dermatophilaceae bacterium]|nr:UDP-N-acetylglucosamine pyrophosphorylase [Dermatophilaceae bacterium]
MNTQPRSLPAVERLLDKGVDIPNPWTLDIGPEVDLDRVSGQGVTIFPGCRIYGATTVISAGVHLGAEGPVTLQDCRLGPNVQLKGGYAAKAVFLEKANMGLGHHVREGCLLEEEAGGAHCVALKQTILFPFVTLGSLINFCDCLMAGGTSRKDHSEVGSSYIHFNFTPDGDKTTPSLFGDVPRGVLLGERPIFLGGQGGTVGPVRVGFGSVVAAGSVLRSDVPEDQLVMAGPLPNAQMKSSPSTYRAANRLVAKNVLYLAQLRALRAWYETVRRPFFAAQELGLEVYQGALDMLASAVAERTTRLTAMVAKVPAEDDSRAQLKERIGQVCRLFDTPVEVQLDHAVAAGLSAAAGTGVGYIEAIRGLDGRDAADASHWLQGIVDQAWAEVVGLLPALGRLPRP